MTSQIRKIIGMFFETKPAKCEDTSTHHLELEIGDINGRKWISTKKSQHDHIPVQLNPTEKEVWRLERCDNDPLWSFHILSSDNKKMYVTYNASSDDVTLEYEETITKEEGKRRFFTMHPQHDTGVFLRAENTKNRFLRNNGGQLEMATTENPADEMKWFITPSFEDIQTDLSSFNVQIEQMAASKKWIGNGSTNSPIQVQQTSATQDWQLTYNADNTMSFLSGGLYATGILYFGSTAGEFTFDGNCLECSGQYVAAPSGNGDLFFVSTTASATTWDVKSTGLILKRGDELIIFPFYPIEDRTKNTKSDN